MRTSLSLQVYTNPADLEVKGEKGRDGPGNSPPQDVKLSRRMTAYLMGMVQK